MGRGRGSIGAVLPAAILFDLDDTILASDVLADATWRRLCDAHAAAVRADADSLYGTLCRVRERFWSDPERHRVGRLDLLAARRAIARETFETLGLSDPAGADALANAYAEERERTIEVFPGAVETLAALLRRGVALALITNGASDVQRRKIRRFDLDRYFRSIFIEGEVGVGKPDPQAYRNALDALGVAPRDAWMVGDNLDWDVRAPMALGIRGIWHDHAGKGLPPGSAVVPDRIVRSLPELLRE
jgi:putative hydrolase of the HAD superfamily